MIYPLDEPLYSKYIKPLVDVINKHFIGDGVMIYVDVTSSQFIIHIDLLLDDMKTRTRVLNLFVTDQLKIIRVYFKALPSLAACMENEIREIVPQAKINYIYTYLHVKRRTAI